MKLIFPILFTLLSVAAFIFGVNPFYKDVKSLRSDIIVYNTALSNSTNLQKTEDSLIKAYNEIRNEDKDRLSKFLPSTVNNIQFILEIERIANLHNMPIKDIKFQTMKKNATPENSNIVVSETEEDNRPYGVFPIGFTTEGDYDSFVSFLKDLEYNLRLIDVKSVSFSIPDPAVTNIKGAETPVDSNIYKYSLEVETYWLK